MKKKLKGSTLIEIIFAMLIMSITFFMSYTIIANTMGKTHLITKSKYQTIANNEIYRILKSDSFENREIKEDNIIIKCNMKIYSQMNNLLLIEVEVFNSNGKSLAIARTLKQNTYIKKE